MERYKLERELGRGSTGAVHKAKDTLTLQTVAVKVFHDFPGVPVRELSIAYRVTHPYVCRIYTYQEEDGIKFLVMEYIDGCTLADRLREGPLSWNVAHAIAGELLDGLEAIHKMGSMHLDLKPANIMLTRDGHVKILDFGQARPIASEDFETGKAPGGTPSHRAPEQASGAPCDARADLFNFGLVLGEMLSGEHPRPPAPLELPAGVPGDVRSAIERCLEVDRKNRFNSAAECRSALGLALPQLQPSRGHTALLTASATALILLGLYFFSSVGAVYDRPFHREKPPLQKQAAKTIRRVAVLGFHNLGGDASLEPYTAGISETVATELAQITGLTVVDRGQVLVTVHDMKVPEFDLISAADAREIGKAMGVDALITGTLQKTGTDVRLIGRIVDPATGGLLRSPATVDGAFQDLFKLQGALARQLAALLHGTGAERSQNAPPDGHSIEAFQAFSSGVYYFEKDLAADALKAFDRTLSIDPQYPGANHYRGLALLKMNRLDDAADAFKRALPQSESDQTVTWSWDPMYSNPVHGIIRANDTASNHSQRDKFAPRRPTSLQRAAWGERNRKTTVLQFMDLVKRAGARVAVADENILLNTAAFGNDSLTIVPAIDAKAPAAPQKIGLYAFSNDGSLVWHTELGGFGDDVPRYAPIGGAVYVYSPALRRFDLLDGRTGGRLWSRENLAMDGVEAPWTAATKAYGDIFIFRSEGTYHAIRKSDGTDAWTVRVQSQKPSELLTDKGLVVFEPERRIFIVDLETGRTAGEIAMAQFADALRTSVGPKYLVSAMVQGNILYMMPENLDFCAIDLATARILWRAPLKRNVQHIRILGGRLYLGTAQGDIVVLDAASGAVIHTIPVAGKGVLLDHVGDDGLIVRSGKTLYSFTLDGIKKWEYPGVDMGPAVTFVDRAAVFYRSPPQISAVDTETGEQLWQYQSAGTPSVLAEAGRLFVLDDTGVKQYRTSGPSHAVAEMTTLTELARTYLAKHDLNQARVFAANASVLDPDYPPLVLLQARLSQAAGNTVASGQQLARYADLVGLDSKEGRRTIDDLKQNHGLLWVSRIGTDVAGDPVLIGNRLVSVGRKSAQDAEGVPLDRAIVALDPETGAIAWRFATERFTASIAVNGPRPYLYYAEGSQADLNSVFLYRVDAQSGERKQIAAWKGKQRIDQAWIAFSSGRLFVASVVPDINTHSVQVFVDAFDAASGAHAWTHNQTLKIGALDAGEPIRAFVASGNAVAYTVGQQTYPLRVADGSLQPAAAPASLTRPTTRQPELLWPASTTLIDGRRLFAFTPQGHAFALKLK